MIASPGDVENERQITKQVIHEWNSLHSENTGIILIPISWETHSSPEIGDRPQAIINKQVLKDTDLLIGIFWTRLGTPTDEASSGTVEEIKKHVKTGKPAMLYFSNNPAHPDSIDKDQYAKLKEFKKSMESRSLYHQYSTLSQFKEDLYRHLVLKVYSESYFKKRNDLRKNIQSEIPLEAIESAKSAIEPILSKEAEELLSEASKDKNGYILKLRTSSGTIIQTNSKNMVTSQEARIVAKWEHALNELVENDFVEERGYKNEVFAVTHKGYEYLDKLLAW